ncbi:unconventional myosin-VIIb [Eleutherodactylus coqui]|uniref:unconventional myosin-VIIb n=1 Tax=Eleutherodactylus coqui TaxID=57060 RepID=UPI00346211B7
MTIAVKVDCRLRARLPVTRSENQPLTSATNEVEAVEVGSMSPKERKEFQLRNQLCLYCGGPDHWEIAFLGYVISPSAIRMDSDKVKAITEWVQPANLKTLQRFLRGEHVWLEIPSNSRVPIGAVVKDTHNGQILLVDDDGKEHWISARNISSIHSMHPSSAQGAEDMIRLGDLNEAVIVHNLHIRYKENNIYTYTGAILVAVNPYEELPLYHTTQIHLYRNRRIGELPPHIFALADTCYFNMQRKRTDQCCVISGESGAGKTESTKLMLQFLASSSGQHSWIEQQILEANPIMEAFGNAKTIRNDNSSRFGKYIEIHFSRENIIEGARIEQFLLEKSRVCRQATGERNYHIFYCMLLGMSSEEKKKLKLEKSSDYKYLTMGNCTSCDGRDDTRDFAQVCSAMKILLFSEQDLMEINRLLAAMLHLGNLDFQNAMFGNIDGCDVPESIHLSTVATLLEVNLMELKSCLTRHTIIVRGDSVSKPLSCSQASDGRDAFTKGIYGRMFMWIVNKINEAIFTPTSKDLGKERKSIGLLDIFGFEHFNTNSFEQLCINFANEHLQQFFVSHIFKLEQEEYNTEQIPWQHIDFTDNQHALDIIALRPMNIISLIDEESKFPQGTDATMLRKLNNFHSKSNIYIASKSVHDTKFGINHFAGLVYYETEGFLDKNRDLLSSDLILLMHSSTSKFLKQIFQVENSSNTSIRGIIRNAGLSYQKITDTNKSLSTLGGQFKQSLEQLMKILGSCQPYFVRCIKPNEFKKPLLFDRELCIRQLRYSGMMETIRIRKAGYPIRYSFSDFFHRFRVLLPLSSASRDKWDHLACCIDVVGAVIGKDEDWKVGKTKLFLKDRHDTKLEVEREKALTSRAVLIQRVLRGFKDRKRFLKQKDAAVKIQAVWRGYHGRKSYQKMQHGFQRLQAVIRSRHIRLKYQKSQAIITKLQARCRGYLVRKRLAQEKNAALVLQTYTRRMLARNKYERMRKSELLIQQELEMEKQRQMLQKELLLQQEKENLAMVEQVFGFLPLMDVDSQSLDEIDLDTLPLEPEKVVDHLAEFTFPKFAATYFQGSATDTYIRKALHQPLLYHEDHGDVLASLAVWKIILRFMGDLPEPVLYTPRSSSQTSSVITQIYDTLTRKNNNFQAGIKDSMQGVNQEGFSKEISSMKFKRSSKLAEQISSQLSSATDIQVEESSLIDKPMSMLEKVHFIVGNGILRPEIRDEIYCQICKQLSGNNNKNSYARGWILLSLCLGCFPPTEKFIKYLQNFIRGQQIAHSSVCMKQLIRTMANGIRSEPPSWLELQALKGSASLEVPVKIMTGETVIIQADSATSAKEICRKIAQKLKMKDIFGFSVYISIYDQVWSLGGGSEHLMDGISQCEQLARERGDQEKHAPWRVVFRKEVFAPWHNSSNDPVSTDLIYNQVIRGLCYGEYRCEKEDALVELMSKHYYIKYGEVLKDDHIQNVLKDCIPAKQLASKPSIYWANLLKENQAKAQYIIEKIPTLLVKEMVVNYSQQQWPLLFSKFFEASRFAGPTISRNHFIVAINWKGVSFLDETEKKLLDLTFPELTGILTKRAEKSFGQCCVINTLRGEQFVLTSQNSEEIAKLLLHFLDGLKERSLYAVALEDSSRPLTDPLDSKKKTLTDEPDLLSFRNGDLLFLNRSPELQNGPNWTNAQNERTGNSGVVPLDAIYIVPALTKPSSEMLRMIAMSPEQRKSELISSSFDEFTQKEVIKPYTLEEFSMQYFRPPDPESVSKAFLQRSRGKSQLWAHSKEPLRQPLLRKVCEEVDLRDYACQAFIAIMKYMGDYPSKQSRSPVELTDQIFSGPVREECLRDEIYCQILKQMTSNSNSYSLSSGWQLLWLCTGLFPPSKSLLVHVQKFIENQQKEPLSKECKQRIQRVLQNGPRKQPPHQVEVEAIQQMSTKIYHKVYFPNGTEEAFEVGTNTKVREVCQNISNKLQLSSWDGFSVFLKIGDKVISLNEQDYFYDALRQLNDYIRKSRPTAGAPTFASFQLHFMRKLWVSVLPGKDIKADTIFHYHQELPKYMRGYHHCTVEDAVNLAALIYKIQYKNDRSQLINLNKILRDLVPEYLLRMSAPEEWKKNIIASYNKHEKKTVEEAKVAFLKHISRWPTFGSAFFEVKQSSEPSFPDIVLIAINKHGVSLFHPKTKELLVNNPLNKISRWNSGNTYFQMTTGNLVRDNKILCETSLGYKMDDLLTSYISYFLSMQQKPTNA